MANFKVISLKKQFFFTVFCFIEFLQLPKNTVGDLYIQLNNHNSFCGKNLLSKTWTL